jgi:hypothetical protein
MHACVHIRMDVCMQPIISHKTYAQMHLKRKQNTCATHGGDNFGKRLACCGCCCVAPGRDASDGGEDVFTTCDGVPPKDKYDGIKSTTSQLSSLR